MESIYINGRRIRKSFDRKTDAKLWKSKMLTARVKNEISGNHFSPTSFDELAKLWHKNKVVNQKALRTQYNYKTYIENKLSPLIGSLRTDLIQHSDIETLQNRLFAQGLSKASVNKLTSIVAQIDKFGLGKTHSQRWFKTSLFHKVDDKGYDFYSEAEVKQLLISNRGSEIYPILFLAIHTGMRRGEILGLCWDKVNFFSNRLEISRSLSRYGLSETTKGKRTRYFPLSPVLKEFFLRLQKSGSGSKFVFTDGDGKPIKPDHFTERQFSEACRLAEVRRLRFHDLRHTFASHFMMSNGNLYELKELLGHSSVDMTQRYAHLTPKHLEKAAGLVNFGIGFDSNGHKMDTDGFLLVSENSVLSVVSKV